MTPYAIYVENGAVHVQWDSRGEFVTLHESGEVTTQFREPRGRRYQLVADAITEQVRKSA